jgi:hypothetical protein
MLPGPSALPARSACRLPLRSVGSHSTSPCSSSSSSSRVCHKQGI